MELRRISACMSLNDSVVTETEAVSNNKLDFLLPQESKEDVPGGADGVRGSLLLRRLGCLSLLAREHTTLHRPELSQLA